MLLTVLKALNGWHFHILWTCSVCSHKIHRIILSGISYDSKILFEEKKGIVLSLLLHIDFGLVFEIQLGMLRLYLLFNANLRLFLLSFSFVLLANLGYEELGKQLCFIVLSVFICFIYIKQAKYTQIFISCL